MKRKYLILFSLSGLIITLDQLTKQWFENRLTENAGHDLIPGLLTLTHRHSVGFAFGLLQTTPERFHTLFLLGIPAFALVLIVLIFIKLRDNQMVTSVALTAILSGAVGNLIDRIQLGYVVDFLVVRLGSKELLPALNVADSAIICGVLLMLINTVRQEIGRTSHV
ncbi:MAG: signal peptidase II [Deltaproteobacteria bacterium]|nr:signal peptidase II [Deltaproteobacteria bacterium]MBI3294127.1 signal peptidase II [Deltaproteobacteria bacterium]